MDYYCNKCLIIEQTSEKDESLMVHDPEKNMYFSFNQTAGSIIALIASAPGISLADIVHHVRTHYGMGQPLYNIETDVMEFLKKMQEYNIVSVADQTINNL